MQNSGRVLIRQLPTGWGVLIKGENGRAFMQSVVTFHSLEQAEKVLRQARSILKSRRALIERASGERAEVKF